LSFTADLLFYIDLIAIFASAIDIHCLGWGHSVSVGSVLIVLLPLYLYYEEFCSSDPPIPVWKYYV